MKSLSALLAVSIVLLAQDSTAQEKSAPCELQVAVTVSNSKTHEVVGDVSADSFFVKSGSSEARPISARLVSVRRVFILVDVSGSVTASIGDWDHLVRTTEEILSTIPQDTAVISVPFAQQSTKIEQRELVAPFLQKLGSSHDQPLGQRTSLYDVLMAVTLAEKISLQDAVIIISDLGDNSSKTSRIKAEDHFRRLGIRPVFILLGNPRITMEGENALQAVQYFVNNTAGLYVSFPGPKPKAVRILPPSFYAQTLSYYQLTFQPDSIKARHLKLSLRNSSGEKIPGVEIRATDALSACDEQTSK